MSFFTTDSFQARSLSTSGLAASEADAETAHLLHLVDHPRHVEERLGGDAAHVEADAAERGVPLDQHRLQTQVRRAECRAVAAGARTDHQHSGLEIDLPAKRGCRGGSGGGRSLRWACGRRGSFGRRGPARRSTSCRGSGGRGRLRRLEHEDHAALADPIPQLDLELRDGAAGRRRDIHHRLVRFEGDDRILRLHLVARLDEHLDDRNVLEIAEVGNLHFLGRHGGEPRSGQSIARRMSARSVPR